ncbi:tetratricopeptide repeat protein [Cytobacillus sp. FSL R7-0696]|uniref:tetratricopeptide repeat protein n=1 Tax=Cytobacillus sp. FSL R7-0696 TaxID=2921691 RepID=UPI0030F7594C
MTKHNRDDKKNKVIPFPFLDRRLLEKGLEALHRREFQEAVEFLTEASELNDKDEDIQTGLVLAFFESGQLQHAQKQAEYMLHNGIGDYLQVVDMYLMILVQLHRYDEIVTTIEYLFEENKVPHEKFEHFSRLLEFSRRMAEADIKSSEVEDDSETHLQLFEIKDQQEQMMLAKELAEKNIVHNVKEILFYLRSEEGHPFFKTLLLDVLKQYLYNKEVIVEKMGNIKSFVPAHLPDFEHFQQRVEMLKVLEEKMEQDDPILLEHAASLVNRHLFLMYPIELEPFSIETWSAAYHTLAIDYLGMDLAVDEMLEKYCVEEEDYHAAITYIEAIEEFSYPKI